MTASPRDAVPHYVIALSLAGTAGVIAATALLPTGGLQPLVATAMAAALVLGTWVPLRFQHRGETQGVTIEEAILVATLLTVPTGWVPLLAAATALVAHGLHRQEPLKLAFNVAQNAVYATVAAVVFHLIGPGPTVLEWRTLVAVAGAGLALNAVSLVIFAELFRRLSETPWRETLRETTSLYAVTLFGNTSAGLLIALLIRVEPAAAILTTSLLVGLYLGYRGYAGVLEERRRNDRLHDVTRSLVGASASPEAMRAFTADVADLLGAADAELLLTVNDGEWRLVHTDPDRPTDRGELGPHLIRVVARPVPIRIDRDDEELLATLATSGHRDALIAPLAYEGRVLGALAVYDRHGLEPWDDTDLTLLASIANEAAVAVRNVELFAAVERERERLAEESQKLGDIVGAASDGIVMVGPDARVAAWNPAMTAITGIATDDALFRPWSLVMRLRSSDNREVVADTESPIARAFAGFRTLEPAEFQVLHADGSWRWVRCSVAPITGDEGGRGIVIVARDVTAEREIAEMKADFVATVSHELRTPLTPIRGGFELLREHGPAMSADQAEKIHGSIARQLDRLNTLVTDLLTVADLDRGAFAFGRGAIDLVSGVRSAVAREVVGDRVTVEAPEALTAIGDEAGVERVVRALVSNALKHTEGGVTVRVRADEDGARVEVIDEGEGIPEDGYERIFERFGRLGDHLHRAQGPGLGLAIARSIARRLGGDVTVASRLGEGSTFTLTLPVLSRHLELVPDPEVGIA